MWDKMSSVMSILQSYRIDTVIEDTGITEEFVCNNNSDCEDVKLEPYKIYDQVKL